jgi:hypothetical protein
LVPVWGRSPLSQYLTPSAISIFVLQRQ